MTATRKINILEPLQIRTIMVLFLVGGFSVGWVFFTELTWYLAAQALTLLYVGVAWLFAYVAIAGVISWRVLYVGAALPKMGRGKREPEPEQKKVQATPTRRSRSTTGKCLDCGSELQPDAVACGICGALVGGAPQ